MTPLPKPITEVGELEALYGTPVPVSLTKVTDHLTGSYRLWIERSAFCVQTTVGPEGTDGSPRGDDGPVVTIHDDQTLLLPDWHGNNRIDSLRNIVRDGRVSLLFLVAGSNNAMRVNGKAFLTADDAMLGRFEKNGKRPRSVIVIRIGEVYSQCARALIRSGLWVHGDQSAGLPTVGQMAQEITSGGVDAKTYDAEWPVRAAKTMW